MPKLIALPNTAIRELISQRAAFRWICYAFCVAISILIGMNGIGRSVDEQARIFRDSIRSHPATGQVHVVEIDAASIAELKSWPWPRHLHGALVDRLREANVAALAFDVDFSSSSSTIEDQAFAAALARFGNSVILPTFRQVAGSGSTKFLENLPIEPLRKHAFLASVNVQPDADGEMRNYGYGTVTHATPRPSVAAMLAGVPGKIDQNFRVDQSIDPATIPRHSFADVLSGKVGQKELAGKTVIVGATAIELGDRYAVPLRGVIPGVIIQALATETLLIGSQNPSYGSWPLLILAAIGALFLLRPNFHRARAVLGVASFLIIGLIPFVLEAMHIATLEIAPALMLISLAWSLSTAIDFAGRMNRARFVDAGTGMPNERALLKSLEKGKSSSIIVFRIGNHAELAAVLTLDQQAMLIKRIEDRVSLAFGTRGLFLLQPGLLGLSLPTQKPEDVIEQMEATAAVFRSPITLDTRQIVVQIACGISQSASVDASQACANARLAADEAASQGHSWAIHSDARLGEANRAIQLLGDIDAALENNDIHVVFQPKWDIAAGRIGGAEALVRWRHPDFGPIAPDHFIPLLETHGRMAALTLHVLDLSLKALCNWQMPDRAVGVAVNISAPLLNDKAFIAEMRSRISKIGELAKILTLEITESATLSDTENALIALKSLHDLGIRLSIDDYGTGQSTLTYLKNFNASEIKIDKSFITNMLASRNDQILVRSTIELAHELGFKVVAEGIEDGECLDMLASFGCDIAQGWQIGKPVPVEVFVASLTQGPAEALARAA
jgi:diguanylate cyclase